MNVRFVKNFYLFFCINFASLCYGIDLSIQESIVLKQFFREMLENSEGGYVLFDAKPVCINCYTVEDDFIQKDSKHLTSVLLREGALVLKNKKFKEQNILIHTYNNNDSFVKNYVHILFINKKLFLDAVQKNLSLFQYVLGPEITPEKLLTKLTDPEETFHGVLKCDKVLIGILLGFGTQNSLYVARVEDLENARFSESPPLSRCISKFSHIPLEYKKSVFLNCLQYNGIDKKASFGNSSIEKEIEKSKQKIEVSSEKLGTQNPNFIFGHLQDDDSKKLIATLENAQEKVQKLLSSEDFFPETLKLAFPEEKISISTDTNAKLSFNQKELERLPFLVAANMWNNMADDGEVYVKSFIEGMKLADANKELPNKQVNCWDCYQQNKLQKIKNNLEDTDKYFTLLSQNSSMKRILELPLYYSLLKNGKADSVKNFTEVIIHYSMEYPDGEVLVDTFKSKIPEKLDLNLMIPGFALGILGMQIGEERELYIHPSLAYGILTALKKGVYLKSRIQLIDIVHNDQKEDVDFSKVEVLDLNKELVDLGLLNQQNRIKVYKSNGLIHGHQMWQHYKNQSLYILPDILKWMIFFKTTDEEPNISATNDQNLINRLHWNLYH